MKGSRVKIIKAYLRSRWVHAMSPVNPAHSEKLTTSALKAAGGVGAVAERFVVALTTAAEAEWFFFGYSGAVGQRDFCFSTFYPGGPVGNDSNL